MPSNSLLKKKLRFTMVFSFFPVGENRHDVCLLCKKGQKMKKDKQKRSVFYKKDFFMKLQLNVFYQTI